MKRIEELQKQLQELEVELKGHETTNYSINQEINKSIEKGMRSFFLNGVSDQVTLHNCTESGFNLHLPHQGYKDGREAIAVYFNKEDWRSYKINHIRPSFYSTTEASEYEFKRMVLIGRVGDILLRQQQEIVDTVNEILLSKREEVKECNTEYYNTKRKIENVRKEIADIQQQELINRLETEGLEFDTDKGIYFDAKFDLTYSNVRKLQILRKTTSGKSVDVKVTFEVHTWDGDKCEERDVIVDRVRMDNIVRFVNTYKNRITV